MADNRIVIDLNETDTQSFKDTNLIQIGAKEKFQNLVEKFIEKNKQNTNQKSSTSFPRVHNTILIDGKRGMGKTSFMLSVLDDEKLQQKICFLEIVDPTLIETSEHVFLNIITRIKCKIDEITRCKECEYANNDDYKHWKESLKKLANGLSMLDGVGGNHLQDNSLWDSPELILERGLSNAKHGYTLEKDFHKFIDESLKIVKKDAFLLVLDDVDTSLDKGKEILEVLRKYLTSPKLIIVMLGDIDLYSILVRQLQWEKMDPKGILQKYEFDLENEKKKYKSQIEHLEEQYLVKVLKPENRINLRNLFDLKENLAINSKENRLSLFLYNLINDVCLTKDDLNTKNYEHLLLTQSTRSILQILSLWNGKVNNKEFVKSIKHIFYTTLKKKLEPYHLLEVPEKEFLWNLLSVYLLKNNINKDMHLEFIPRFIDDEDNLVMFYINAIINSTIKPESYLSYFSKVGYVFEMYKNFKYKNQSKEKCEEFLKLVNINNHTASSIIVEDLFQLYSSEIINEDSVRGGDNTKIKIFRVFANMFIKTENLESLQANVDIDFLQNIYITDKDRQFSFLSFFSLLGYIADISDGILNDKSLEMESWIENIKNVKKIPVFVLAKIWQRFVSSLINIEKKQNLDTKYHLMFELYIAGFLNAVYVEIEHYENRSYKRNRNFFLNVSTSSDTFYDKLKDDQRYISNYKDDSRTYVLKNNIEDYTFFDYLYECPLFRLDSEYFIALSKIQINQEFNDANEREDELDIEDNIEPKFIKLEDKKRKNFGELNFEEQKEAIESIDGWRRYAISTIANYLRYWLPIEYFNVSPSLLRKLLKEMKSDIK